MISRRATSHLRLVTTAGDYSTQAYRAAALYQEVKAAGLTSNIAFTGPSLGGGLASIMAVWFNRPAYVYAPAPFQRSADGNQLVDYYDAVDGQITTIPADQIRVLPLVKAELLLKTGAIDSALASYNPSSDFLTRERNVQAWAVDGELLRKTLFALNWIEGADPKLLLARAGNRETTVNEGTRLSNCAKPALGVFGYYLFRSYLRSVPLGYGPKKHINIAATAPTREALL